MATNQMVNNSSLLVSKMLKKLVIIIPIGVVINLVITFSSYDSGLLETIANFSPDYFALAVLFILLPWFTNTFRLFVWTRFLGTKLSFNRVFRIILMSELGAAISPAAVGGAPVKTGLLIQEKMPSGAALSLATIASIEDLAFFSIAVPLALTLSSAWHLPFLNVFYERFQKNLIWLVALVLIVGLITFLVIFTVLKWKRNKKNNQLNKKFSFLQRLFSKGKSILQEFKAAYFIIVKRGKLRFALTTILTGIQWICRYSIITALASSIGLDTNPVLFFVLHWFVSTLSVFVPTPGATGSAEASFYLIFASFLPQNLIGILTAGWRFLAFYLFLGMGVSIYFISCFLERSIKKPIREAELVFVE